MDSNEDKRIGGGSGGDSGMDDDGNKLQYCKSTYQITGNQVALVSRKFPPLNPEKKPGPSCITLLATGGLPTMQDDGRVDIRGAKGVRVTAGGSPDLDPTSPPVASKSTNGVEIVVGQSQNVILQQGVMPLGQTIQMTSSGMTIDAGILNITLKTGSSQIVLTPTSIVIKAAIIDINPLEPLSDFDGEMMA